jgi:hypothetical protein
MVYHHQKMSLLRVEYVKLSRFASCFLTELATSSFFLYLPPLSLLIVIAGLEEAKNHSGAGVSSA